MYVREEGQEGTTMAERGLERGPRAEDRQTGRTEGDWSMDDGRRGDMLVSDQLAQTCFATCCAVKQFFGNEIFHILHKNVFSWKMLKMA